MNKLKKLFNNFLFTFFAVGIMICGLTFSHLANSQGPVLNADQTTLAQAENDVREWFLLSSSNAPEEAMHGNSVFLMSPKTTKINVTMTNGTTNPELNSPEKTNPAFFPDINQTDTYYYFGNFSTSLALYYNITSEDINLEDLASLKDANLLKNTPLTNFVTAGDVSIEQYPIVQPSKFAMNFTLDTSLPASQITLNTITLDKEGLYTLVIPYSYLYTDNGGTNFDMHNDTIVYTFMVFNSSRYLDTVSHLPNVETGHVQTSVANNANYSRYYFFNYDDNPKNTQDSTVKKNANLAYFQYDTQLYQISVDYVDIDNKTTSYTFAVQDNKFVALENDLPCQTCPILFEENLDDSTATLYFNELGIYNISFDFIYRNDNKIFTLPINTRLQRFYVYGYQAFCSTSEKDATTKATLPREIKHIAENKSTYSNSADITSIADSTVEQRTSLNSGSSGINADAIKTTISTKITNGTIRPISTNQTPVKFRSNSNIKLISAQSKVYNVTITQNSTSIDNGILYSGTSFTDAGTYLIVIVYQFGDYLSTAGDTASSYYHYQIFYFTITNETPSVTVRDINNKDIATNGFTNSDVVIMDNSAISEYDAPVKITLTAQDYTKTNVDFFTKVDFEDFGNGSAYRGITYYENLYDIVKQEEYKNKRGIYINSDNNSPYHNAKFKIEITSQDTAVPATRNFTIDTNPIGEITARNTSFLSSTTYSIDSTVTAHKSNRPLIFSWSEKESTVPTHGVYKFFPISSLEYYRDDNNTLLKAFLENTNHSSIVPINSMLDISNSSAGWTDYSNTVNYKEGTVPVAYTRMASGIYIFEVYDDAGNYSFDVFLLDNTSPLFIKSTENQDGITTLSILNFADTLTVTSEYSYKIVWGAKKGIYIKGLNTLATASDNYLPEYLFANYSHDGLSFTDSNPLKDAIYKFFAENSSLITDIQGEQTADGQNDITDFNGRYITINILPDAMIKPAGKDNYLPENTLQPAGEEKYAGANIKEIVLIDENNNAVEGAYKFLIRDESNQEYLTVKDDKIVVPEQGYKLAPSAYLTLNVTSDSSRLTFYIEGWVDQNGAPNQISPAGYSRSEKFYQDEDGNLFKNQTGSLSETEGITYKYTYFAPIKTKNNVTLSYIPHSKNGSLIQSITLDFYPFVQASEKVVMQNHSKTLDSVDTYTANAFYYTLSTQAEHSTIFELTTQNQGSITVDDGNGNTAKTYRLALSADEARPGKYVFTRRYSLTSGSIDKFDFYERTLTLIIDRNELISATERITDGTNTSVESIVGGDIMISMYSTKGSDAQSVISLAYPNYNPETGLNEGYLYTQSNFAENDNVRVRLESNKLPVSVLIPTYKYTTYNNYDYKSNSYSVNVNNDLSYYGGFGWVEEPSLEDPSIKVFNVYTALVYTNKEGKPEIDTTNSLFVCSCDSKDEAEEYINQIKDEAKITEYGIYAKIRYAANESSRNYTWYRSKGESTGNYLNFYQVSGADAEFADIPENATPVKNFTAPGIYIVTLYQANNQDSKSYGESSFNSLYKFSFRITSPTPDFTVKETNGATSLDPIISSNETNYYTNKQHLTVSWEDSSSNFIAKIDQSSIKIQKYDSNTIGAEETVEAKYIQSDGNSHWFEIDLGNSSKDEDVKVLNMWHSNNRLKISMKYEGYPDNTRVTKFINIDYTAPVENLTTLLQKTEQATIDETTNSSVFSRLFQEKNMRTLYSFDMSVIDTSSWTSRDDIQALMENVSYSFSAVGGNYSYFSYMVTLDFFTQAAEKLSSASQKATDAQDLYFKRINETETGPLDAYTPANESFSRFDNSYQGLVKNSSSWEVVPGAYYEIVEQDKAGNMVVYVVYVQNLQNDVEALSYTNQATDEQQPVYSSQIEDGFNIYSNEGFTITNLNYNNDAWAIYRVVINGKSSFYMKSPWLKEEIGDIYEITSGSAGVLRARRYDEIFANGGSSTTKHSMYISDRATGQNKHIYISSINLPLKETHYSSIDQATVEILDVPTLDQINNDITVHVFPKKISIAYWDTSLSGSGDWNWSLLNEVENESGNPTDWAQFNNDFVKFEYNGNLVIKLTVQENYSTKFRYKIEDNFGNILPIYQLVNEEIPIYLDSKTTIYTFEEATSTTYMSASNITYRFNRLLYSAKITKVLNNGSEVQENIAINDVTNSISEITLSTLSLNNYDRVCTIELRDCENPDAEKPERTVNLRVYNKLPVLVTERQTESEQNDIWFVDKDGETITKIETVSKFSVNFNNKTYEGNATSITTFSNSVTLNMDRDTSFVPGEFRYQDQYTYSAYFSQDGVVWTNISVQATSGYVISDIGSYYILIKYDDEEIFENEYKLFIVNILNSNSISYYFHVDGMPVEARRNFIYTDPETGDGITTVYFLNVDYHTEKNARVSIEPNEELGTIFDVKHVPNTTRSPVEVEIYTFSNRMTSKSKFAVIYIGQNDSILQELTYINPYGGNENLLQAGVNGDVANPAPIFVENEKYNELIIRFWNQYGIKENTINVQVLKYFDGQYREVNVIVYPDEQNEYLSYIKLTRAGIYQLKFQDSCVTPNVHKFNKLDHINIVFLNSVPFTITYTDPETQNKVTSEPINHAYYNGEVTINVDRSSYFADGYPKITIIKDGVELPQSAVANSYTLTETGNYSITFDAYQIGDRDEQHPLRKGEAYSFTIINENESRLSFEYPTTSTYRITKILRDGIDVTQRFVDILDENKTTIDGKKYLTSLQLSYYDEKTVNTKDRRFIVTIETGEQTYANTTATSFTFAFRINYAKPLITVDVARDGTTTGVIHVTFNIKTLYQTVGDCRIELPGLADVIVDSSALDAEQEIQTKEITQLGTNYIKIYSLSGNLLESYRITRNQPLGVWEILAIVIAVVVLAVVIFVTIKLRKRLKVK